MFAALHLLALGVGLGAIWARARLLAQPPLDRAALDRVFVADGWWAGAAALWISTGVIRMLSGLDKGPEYYINNRFFQLKMLLFLAVLVLEVRPMRLLLRWRKSVRHEELPDMGQAEVLGRISSAQAFLIIAMLFAATAMARGLGMT